MRCGVVGIIAVVGVMFAWDARSEAGETSQIRTGWFTHAGCALKGEVCSPDHAWKKGDAIAFTLPDGSIFFPANLSRDILVHFFLKPVSIKGKWYEEKHLVEVEGLKVRQEGKWKKVLGEDFPPAELAGGKMKVKRYTSRSATFTGFVTGYECALHNMVCDVSHLWKNGGEYLGLFLERNPRFLHIIGVPKTLLVFHFTKKLTLSGTYFEDARTLKVEKVSAEGKVIWEKKKPGALKYSY